MGVPIRRGSDPSVQSTGSLPEHGLSGSDRNLGCDLRSSDGAVTESAKVYASITTGNAPAKTHINTMMNGRQDHEDL